MHQSIASRPLKRLRLHLFSVAFLPLAVGSLSAQSTSFVYRLGKDTVAVEQYTRTGTRLSGEMVQRSGAALTRMQYDVVLDNKGQPTRATVKRLQADGTLLPNSAAEIRFQFTADSVVRELVWPDSVQRRAFAASRVLLVSPTYAYGLTELFALRKQAGGSVDSVSTIGIAGGMSVGGLLPAGGDTVRLRGGSYPMRLRFDARARLLVVDGAGTTNKVSATRVETAVDLAAIARAMKPTGTLSARDVARGAFGAGGMVLVDYSRPQVRERTVWGGRLVPYDSVWRAGANDATHLFTTRTLTMGALTVPPGMYSLWVQHTRSGTYLIVNKQTGQWGTGYDAAQDLGRVPMQMADAPSFVEEMTIIVRATAANRGVLEMAWGPSVLSLPFGVSITRP